MALDAIIISDSGVSTYSKTSPMRLKVNDQEALIHTLRRFSRGDTDDDRPVVSWQRAPRLNGIVLWDHLTKNGVRAELVNNFYGESDRFAQLLKQKPKFIILSTTYILNKAVLFKICREIKSLAKDIVIIAGGPYVYTSYRLMQRIDDDTYDTDSPKKDYLFLEHEPSQEPEVDYCILSQSGLAILDKLISRLQSNAPIDDIANIAINTEDGYRFTAISTEAAYEKPCIDWSSVPAHLFHNQVMSLQASNGCPFHCAYCNFVKDPKATYVKPLDALVEELKAVQRRGIRFVRFVDDNLRLGAPDLERVCRRFIEENLGIKWMSFLRLNSLNGVDLKLLKKAGCIEVQMGLESADKQVLKNMNKQIDPDGYLPMIQALLAEGIDVTACFIIGFPGETLDSVDTTMQFINKVDSKNAPGNFTWSAYPFILGPLSPIYEPDKRKAYGLHGYMANWKHATMDSTTAQGLIKTFYLNIENSSPICSGDDLDIMRSLSDNQRKHFLLQRFELSKKRLRGEDLSDADVMAAFKGYFQPGLH